MALIPMRVRKFSSYIVYYIKDDDDEYGIGRARASLALITVFL